MMSVQKLLLFVFVFVFAAFQTDARICENLHVRNSVQHLESQLRGCTVVLGNLKIVLIEQNDFENVTFPELREITGFLLLFRVYELTSLGKLFPNLTVIRGDTLLVDYALVIVDLPHLKEIGLSNLRYIGRGSTRIQKCPELCFVDTIDWSEIGTALHSLDYYNENEPDCAFCPEHCNGKCWDSNTCQEFQDLDECDYECLGCTKSHPNVCRACKSLYLDNEKCVHQCPENRLANPETRSCVTKQECSSIKSTKWRQFNGQCLRECPEDYMKVSEDIGWCIYCGERCYQKICKGGLINKLWDADEFRGCTHIKGHLEINVNSAALENELEITLGKIQEIDDYLKIERSTAISSLNFLKNLKLIKGKELKNNYSLLVYENQNLRELFNSGDNFTLKLERGKLFFHNNPILCLSEIHQLIDVVNLSSVITEIDVSPYSNGDRTVCRHVNLKERVTEVNSTDATLIWQALVVDYDDLVVGYTVHYIEDQFGNVSFAHGREECFEDEWHSRFLRGTTKFLLTNLNSYTQYAYYLQVHTVSPGSGGFTKIQRFTTLKGFPSPPKTVNVVLTTTNSITVAWEPPEYPSGLITSYKINLYLEEDKLMDYNYCFQPHFYKDFVADVEEPLEVWTNSTSSCCRKQNWQEWKRMKRSSPQLLEEEVAGNITQFTIQNLQHFKVYVFFIMVCNDAPECSSGMYMYQRTQPKEDADDLPPGIFVEVNQNNVSVKWLEPLEPNTEITSYLLEYKRADLEHAINNLHCVTRNDYKNQGYGQTITNLQPGRYLLTIKAVSLAGPGRPSESVEFEIIPTLKTSWTAYLITVLGLFILLFTSGLIYYLKSNKKGWVLFKNSRSAESIVLELQYELLRKDVEVEQEIEGTFGVISNGFIKSQNRPCTIKFVDQKDLFLKDVASMKLFNSYHVVNLLGVVIKNQPAFLVMELMSWGDLKSFLKRSQGSKNITHVEMYRMAAEIADGMMYLSSKKFTHRDLAARNCLVSAGYTVKLVNFGINKDLYKTDYYKKNTGEVIPVRWMPPESLADGIITIESNVWSYGIVLWEIVTFAQEPYENFADDEVIRYVIGQKVLEPPPNCPELLYEIMVACWRWRSKNRPNFVNLLKQLQSHVRRDFKLVSFYHSRDATPCKLEAKNREARKMFDEQPAARWNKNAEGIELCSAGDGQSQSENFASTSSHI